MAAQFNGILRILKNCAISVKFILEIYWTFILGIYITISGILLEKSCQYSKESFYYNFLLTWLFS